MIGFERCKRCNRPLKDHSSIEKGYGPICWEKEQKQLDFVQLTLFDFQDKTNDEYESYQRLLDKQIQKELKKVILQ